MFIYDEETVEKALSSYEDQEFKDQVRNTMKILDRGVASADEMVKIIEKVELQAENSIKKAER